MDSVYLAIDPGQTTGYAMFNAQGIVTFMGKIKGEDKFLDELELLVQTRPGLKTIIMETYRNRPGATNAWSKGATQQHIGAIKRIARKAGVKVVEQEPSPALVIGLKFIGMSETYKNKHVPDEVSALAHGTYYLRKNKIL